MSASDTADLAYSTTIDVTCTLSFPKLLEAEEGPGGDLQYSCALLFDPDDKPQMDALSGAMNAAIQKKWRGRPPDDLTFPLHRGDAKSYAGYAGKLYLNVRTKDRPVLLAWRDKRPASAEDLIPGYIVVARISAFGYDNRSKGVSFALNALWVIKRGERLDGRPTETYTRESIGDRISGGRMLQIESEVEEVPAGRPAYVAGEARGAGSPASTQSGSAVVRLMASLKKPD
jgi:hypothetical protein